MEGNTSQGDGQNNFSYNGVDHTPDQTKTDQNSKNDNNLNNNKESNDTPRNDNEREVDQNQLNNNISETPNINEQNFKGTGTIRTLTRKNNNEDKSQQNNLSSEQRNREENKNDKNGHIGFETPGTRTQPNKNTFDPHNQNNNQNSDGNNNMNMKNIITNESNRNNYNQIGGKTPNPKNENNYDARHQNDNQNNDANNNTNNNMNNVITNESNRNDYHQFDEKTPNQKESDPNIEENRRNKKGKVVSQDDIPGTKEQKDVPSDIKQKSEEEYKFSRYKKCSKVGLKKINGSSYLNSVIQCFNSIQSFANHNLKPKNMKFMEDSVKIMPLSFTISRLYYHFYPYPENDKSEPYNTSAIKLVLEKFNPYFKSDKERNPIRFLIYLLDKLNNEYFKSSHKNSNNANMDEGVIDKYNKTSVINHGIEDFNNKNKTFISQLFGWFGIESLTCTSCKKTMFNFQLYFTLDLDIEDSSLLALQISNNSNIITIYDCLKYYLLNKEKSLTCEQCHQINKMNSIKQIYSPPNYFIFTFNWFFDDGIEQNKVNNVKLQLKSEYIQLEPFIINNINEGIYGIIGIVSYSATDKKFIAYYLSPVDNKWYYCNDEKVDEITFDEIKRRNDNGYEKPFILFCKTTSIK